MSSSSRNASSSSSTTWSSSTTRSSSDNLLREIVSLLFAESSQLASVRTLAKLYAAHGILCLPTWDPHTARVVYRLDGEDEPEDDQVHNHSPRFYEK